MATSTASPVLGPLLLIFGISERLLARAIGDLSDADFVQRPDAKTNAVAWVAAHAVEYRARMLSVLGTPFDSGWGGRFERGADTSGDVAYPSRDEVTRTAAAVNAQVHATLSTLTDAALAEPAKGPVPPGITTIADQIAFFALHDSYHVGQLAYMRKALGYPQLVG